VPNFIPATLASAVFHSSGKSLLSDLPAWGEAMLIGIFLGGYLGLWCALLYRYRAGNAVRRMRAQFVKVRPARPDERNTSSATVADDLHEHVEALNAALGSDATAEWSGELKRHQDRLIRLHRPLE
jgi:gas vesicle protein